MPTLTATSGGVAAPVDQIKRVDLTPEDVRKMSDEDIATHLAALRRSRETSAPRAGKTAARAARTGQALDQLIDDGDLESDV